MKIISPYHHPRPHLQCCRTRRPFFEGQSAAYAEQILSAASYCHQRGIQWRVFFGGIFGGFFGGFSAPRNIGLVQSRKSYRKRNQWIFAGFCSVNHWNVWTDSIQRSKFVVDMNEPSNLVNLTWLNHQTFNKQMWIILDSIHNMCLRSANMGNSTNRNWDSTNERGG